MWVVNKIEDHSNFIPPLKAIFSYFKIRNHNKMEVYLIKTVAKYQTFKTGKKALTEFLMAEMVLNVLFNYVHCTSSDFQKKS